MNILSKSHNGKLLLWLSILTAFAGFFIRLWIAKQWVFNFDSDEAQFGIMASRLLSGEYTPTVYGTEHLGSLEAILGAFFFQLFGEGVFQLRMSVTVLIVGFFLANIVYIRRNWGDKAALYSTLFLILPGFHILEATHQTSWNAGALLALGTTFLVVEQTSPASSRTTIFKYLSLGILAGLGLWSNQMFLVYLTAPLITRFLSSDDWAARHQKITEWVENRFQTPVKLVFGGFLVGLFLLFVLAFFIGGCPPRELFRKVSFVVKMFFLAASLLSLVLFTGKKALRRSNIAMVTSFIAGLAIGFSPQWVFWLQTKINTAPILYPSCPKDIPSRLILTARDILPAMWGIPTLTTLLDHLSVATIAWSLVIAVIISALIWVSYHYRKNLIQLLSLFPTPDSTRSINTAFLLFAIPIILSLLGGNTVDIYSVRHLLVSWHASAILFAIFLSKIQLPRKHLAGLMAAVWIGSVGAYNLINAPRWWNIKFTTYFPEDLQELETFLSQEDVPYGYADYWGAFTLDFLTQERLTIAPYNGINRIPSYSKAVRNTSPFSFIFPYDHAPSGEDQDELCEYISREHFYSGEGPAKTGVVERCRAAKEVSRAEVAVWEVWILDDVNH